MLQDQEEIFEMAHDEHSDSEHLMNILGNLPKMSGNKNVWLVFRMPVYSYENTLKF